MVDQLFTTRQANTSETPIIADHLRCIALEVGLPAKSIRKDWLEHTIQFVDRARQLHHYQSFIAEINHKIIDSASCQIIELYPMVSDADQKGYIWGVYVEPAYRRQGIATELMTQAMTYLKSISCTHAVLHASETGKQLYASLDYHMGNEMVIQLSSFGHNPTHHD